MIKVVVFSDLHLDEVTAGVPRHADVDAALLQIEVECARWRPDLALCLGDLMNPDRGSSVFRCVRSVVRTARHLSDMGVHNFWVRGNHDVIEDGSDESTLAPLYALGGATRAFDRPECVYVRREGAPVASFVALPYPSAAAPYDPAEFARTLPDLLGSHKALPMIVGGHLQFDGIVPGEETGEMGRGRDVPFPLEEVLAVPAASKLLVNGHYHVGQNYRGVIIPGSLARLRFGPQESTAPRFLKFEIPEA